jgi:hypothetical protein
MMHNSSAVSPGQYHKFNDLVRRAGFDSHADLASHIAVHRNSIGNWSTGKSPVPVVVILYLELRADIRGLL